MACTIGQNADYCFTIVDDSTGKQMGVNIGGINIDVINNKSSINTVKDLFALLYDQYMNYKNLEMKSNLNELKGCPTSKNYTNLGSVGEVTDDLLEEEVPSQVQKQKRPIGEKQKNEWDLFSSEAKTNPEGLPSAFKFK